MNHKEVADDIVQKINDRLLDGRKLEVFTADSGTHTIANFVDAEKTQRLLQVPFPHFMTPFLVAAYVLFLEGVAVGRTETLSRVTES